jgi:hypothetical protein
MMGMLIARVEFLGIQLSALLMIVSLITLARFVVYQDHQGQGVVVSREAVYSSVALVLVGGYFILIGVVVKLLVSLGGSPQIFLSVLAAFILIVLFVALAMSGSIRRRWRGMVDRSLSRSNISRKIAARVPHFLAIPGILENSDLIATIPLGVAKVLSVRHRLKIMPLPFEMPHFEVGQYWHKRFHREPGVTWLRDTVQKFFANKHELHEGRAAIGRRTGRGA